VNKPNPFADLDALRRESTEAFRLDELRGKPVGEARARRNGPRYVQLTELGAKAGFQALGCPLGMVWFEILYRVWKTGKTTVELGNKTLGQMGVSRWTKYRAFARLEKAGLIQVVKRDQKSLTIKLLKRGCVVFYNK
jgi:hypothetical protein